jgi:hypothetical protein
MNADDPRKQAERLFKQHGSDDKGTEPDYEARARDIRKKIEYLRSLRLATPARAKNSNDSAE